jgi:Tol biopolymer transport system component
MSVQAGSRLGPYELVAPLGAGGMGEVWRGRDTRLGREVAVKILPAGFAADEQFKARFEREARTISALNHPHICTLFDVGSQDGTQYLVMELLEGEALADRLQRGPLPLDQVLRLGAQVADALERAHRQGIVHRDLKPGNIVLTRSGAKLLDFGLAATRAEAPPGSTELPTQAKPLTTAGTVLGTFQYMAPEQLEGADADARTDIFALGAVLYEMTTGRRAFEGKTRSSLIAAIVSAQPPPISALQPVAPPALDHVVRRCLEKDPDDRWQSAHDVASELRWISDAGSQAGAPAKVTLRRRHRERLAWTLAAVFAVAAAAAAGWALRLASDARAAQRPLRAELVPAKGMVQAPVVSGPVAISPDGTRVALALQHQPRTSLAIRSLESGEMRVLAGTDGGTFPFWSPDGRWLGFFADGRLRKMQADGGPVQSICEAHAGRGGAWGADDTIVFAPDIRGPLMRVSAGGGAATPATPTPAAAASHRNPHFLPDGRHFLFTDRGGGAELFGAIAVGSLDGGEPRRLVQRGSNPQYADGHLFYVAEGNLVAQRFDERRLAVVGAPLPVADSIEYFNARDLGNFTVSRTGILVYRQGRRQLTQLAWVDRAGKTLATVGEPSYYGPMNLSANGRTLAVVRTDERGDSSDVWTFDLARGQLTRSTFAATPGLMSVAMSPDGERVAVANIGSGGAAGPAAASVWIQPASGSGKRQNLLDSTAFIVREWTRDGRYLVGEVQEAGTGFDVAFVRLGEAAKVEKIVSTPFDEASPTVSPDGRWLAFQSNETGNLEVYVTDFPSGTRKWQVSRGGGRRPSWRDDGRELYFVGSDRLGAVAVAGGPLFENSPPQPLPFGDAAVTGPVGGVPSPDGKRFLIRRYASEEAPEPLRLVRSWRALLDASR